MLKLNSTTFKTLNANCTLLLIIGLATMGLTGFAQEKTDMKPTPYETRFGREEWNPKDWISVKSPRWDYIGDWVQEDEYIRNRVPEGIGEDQLISSSNFCAYVSMVHATPFDTGKGLNIRARMSFSFDQGPQIVLADRLGANEDGYPEFRDHYEIVLYSKGINVWRHVYREGNPDWALVAYARFPLEAKTAYDLAVRIEPIRQSKNGPVTTGRVVVISVDDQHTFAFHAPELPESVYAGIIGYASYNRFYHFSVSPDK